MVEGRRRLHRRDRQQVFGALDRSAVARLATEALAEHPDAAVREVLRGKPLDEIVRVSAGLPEAAVVPCAPGSTDTAEVSDEGVVATPGEEVGFADVEVAQDDVRRELHHDPGERAVHRYTAASRTPELTGDRDAVSHRHVDGRPDDLVLRRPFVRPPLAGRTRHRFRCVIVGRSHVPAPHPIHHESVFRLHTNAPHAGAVASGWDVGWTSGWDVRLGRQAGGDHLGSRPISPRTRSCRGASSGTGTAAAYHPLR